MAFELANPSVFFYLLVSLASTASILGIWFKAHLVSALLARNDLRRMPGPIGLPWAGPVWDVDPEHMWLTFGKWAKKYGDYYQVTLFGTKFIIIGHPEIAKDILAKRGASCSDRPPIGNIPNSKVHGKYLPFLGHNDVLRRQRKFGVFINSNSFKTQYHGHISIEVNRLLHKLYKRADVYDVLLEQCFARISCKLAWGVAEPATAIAQNAHCLMRNLSPASRKANVLTFLRHLPKWLSSEKQDERKRSQNEYRLWSGLFQHAEAQYALGKLPPCYARYYFDEPGRSELESEEAIFAVAMMATVAILTLSAPIGWFVVAMAMYPEVQAAAQAEIDSVCGDRMPELSDMPNLPMARAIIIETLRWHGTVPTGIPHVVEEDIKWNGYTIEAGTSVMACDWAMSRNPTIYPSPELFNPTRWLDDSYPTYRGPLTEHPRIHGHHAFGFGRRTCIGQDHVEAVLFSSFTALLWAFDIKAKGNGKVVVRETATPNVIPLPKAQDVQFVPRDEMKRERVQAMG